MSISFLWRFTARIRMRRGISWQARDAMGETAPDLATRRLHPSTPERVQAYQLMQATLDLGPLVQATMGLTEAQRRFFGPGPNA